MRQGMPSSCLPTRSYILGTLLVVLVLFAYCPAATSPRDFLTYDDEDNYVSHSHLDQLNSENLRWALQDGTILGVYEPASLAIKMVQVHIFGKSVQVFCNFSIFLHACVAAGAFHLAVKWTLSHPCGKREATSCRQKLGTLLIARFSPVSCLQCTLCALKSFAGLRASLTFALPSSRPSLLALTWSTGALLAPPRFTGNSSTTHSCC